MPRKMKSYNRIPDARAALVSYLALFEAIAAVTAMIAYPACAAAAYTAMKDVTDFLGWSIALPHPRLVWTVLAALAAAIAAGAATSHVSHFHSGVWSGERPSRSSAYGSARLVSRPRDLRRAFSSWKHNHSPGKPMLVVGGIGSSRRELLCTAITHALVLGGSGSGKTISVLLTTLTQNLTAGATVVVLDPKLEMHSATAAYAESLGYEVHLIDFAHPRASDRWNPLSSAIDCFEGRHGCDPRDVMSEIKMLGDVIIPDQSEGSPMWTQAARMLFCGIATYVVTSSEIPEECRNLSTVAHIAAQTREHVAEIIESLPVGSAARHVLEMSASAPSETYGGFQINLNSFINAYSDPSMSPMLTGNDFSVYDLPDGKHAVFVSFNSCSTAYDALVSAFVTQTIAGLRRCAERAGGRLRNEAYLILEEFGQLPRLPNLIKDSAIIRSMGMHLVVACQDRSQVSARYGRESSALFNNLDTTVFLASKDYETVKHYSDALGCYTLETTTRSQNKNPQGGGSGKSVSFHEARLFRPEDLAKWDWRTGHLVIERGIPYACSSLPIHESFAGDMIGLEGSPPDLMAKKLAPKREERNHEPAPVWRGRMDGEEADGFQTDWRQVAKLAADPRFA